MVPTGGKNVLNYISLCKPGQRNHPYSLALNENPHADFYRNVTSVSKAELLSEVQDVYCMNFCRLLPLM